jgi:hypothetical protein
MKTRTTLLASTLIALACGSAMAQQHANAPHPAVTVAARGTPAFDHAAVAIARRAATSSIDANTFVVGHPASPRWLDAAEPAGATRLAALSR